MLTATVVTGIICVTLFILAYFYEGVHFLGLKIGIKTFLNALPLLIFAFVIAGLIQAIIPKEFILKWLGKEAGVKGILLGCLAGALTPGGPYISFPIVASLYQAGAGIGTIVGFISAWSLWQLTRFPMEIGLVGLRPALIRYASTLIFPPIAGLIAHYFFS